MYEKFIYDVLSNPDNHPRLVQLGVARHQADIEKQETKDFPYVFNIKKVNHVIKFFKGIVLTQGNEAGQLFNLQPWQAFVEASIFGWERCDINANRFRSSYIELPRKNGKSEIKGGEMVYAALLLQHKKRNEVYSVATKKMQAMKCYSAALYMIENIRKQSPYFNKFLTVYRDEIIGEDKTIIKALGKDRQGSFDGLNILYAVIDELHAHHRRDTRDTIHSSTKSQAYGHVAEITTAGMNKSLPCYEIRDSCVKILKGEVVNDTRFTMIWAPDLDEDYDWHNRDHWRRYNPNYGISVIPHVMEGDYQRAVSEGGIAEVEFRVKSLNEWADSAETWIQESRIIEAQENYDIEMLKNREVYAALDLSAVFDLSSLGLVGLPTEEDPVFRCFSFNWIGHDSMMHRVEEEGLDYLKWYKSGHILTCPGNTVDYEDIYNKIVSLTSLGIDLKSISYDPWNSKELISNLHKAGYKVVRFGQVGRQMYTAVKDLPRLFSNNMAGQDQIRIPKNPVLQEAFRKVVLRVDTNDNHKIDKSNAKSRVDPVIALVMAYGQYLEDNIHNPDLIFGTDGF
jgi:phage terminase large subunit-like protein